MLGTSRMADHSHQCMTVGPLCPACEHVLPCLLAAGLAVSWCGMRRLTQRKQLSLVRWSLLVPAWSWLGRAATNRALPPPSRTTPSPPTPLPGQGLMRFHQVSMACLSATHKHMHICMLQGMHAQCVCVWGWTKWDQLKLVIFIN